MQNSKFWNFVWKEIELYRCGPQRHRPSPVHPGSARLPSVGPQGQETQVISNGSPPDLVYSHPESLEYVEGLSFTHRQKYTQKSSLPHLGLLLRHSVALLQRRLQRKEFESPFLIKLSSWFSDRDVFGTGKSQVYQLSPVPSLSDPRHHKTSLTWKGL